MHTKQSAQPHSSLYAPLVKILLAWLVACAFAIGHHSFNASLNNHVVPSGGKSAILRPHSQAGASAIGTTFAFLVSAALGASAGTAFLQCAWRAVRRRSFTIGGLDALWSSPHNVLSFLSIDFWRTGKALVIVAGLSWAFPLVVTFAPGTLTVDTQTRTTVGNCMVPTFDLEATTLLHDELENALFSYFQPSVLSNRVVASTFFGGQPFSPASPCPGNCSYLMAVNAPSFACSPGAQSPSALTWFSPISPLYVAEKFDATPSVNSYQNWDFEGHYTNYSSHLPAPDSQEGNNFTCITYNSTYRLNYTFVGSSSSVLIEQIVLDKPASQLSPPTTDAKNATFIPGTDIHTAWFNATANSYALINSLFAFILGTINVTETQENAQLVSTPATLAVDQTHLVANISNGDGDVVWADVPSAMESLMQNITLSLLTISTNPPQTTQTTCVSSSLVPHFAYNARRLWLVYGLGLGCALICDLVGIIALFQNAFGATAGFSDFLAATRNADLNGIDLNKGVRLRYGPLRNAGGRFAFAQPDSLETGNLVEGGAKEEISFFPEDLYANESR